MTLNYWDAVWHFDNQTCPCDLHVTQFLEQQAVRGASIFHFGTGAHHWVGRWAAEHDNAVLGITASPGEYEAFIKLAIEQPAVARTYKAMFGDIYQLDRRLVPELDVATLFHLCEYRTDKNDAYGALTDLALAELLVDKLRVGGWLLFYRGSCAFHKAAPVIAELERSRPIIACEPFKTLVVYRKGDQVRSAGTPPPTSRA
jgi:hypothetical protein